MAVGSVVAATPSVAATSGTYDIRPGVGAEWVIHNLYVAGAVTITMTDGTNSVTFDAPTGASTYLGLTTHVTNGYYMHIANTGASAVVIAYDGIQTT